MKHITIVLECLVFVFKYRQLFRSVIRLQLCKLSLKMSFKGHLKTTLLQELTFISNMLYLFFRNLKLPHHLATDCMLRAIYEQYDPRIDFILIFLCPKKKKKNVS